MIYLVIISHGAAFSCAWAASAEESSSKENIQASSEGPPSVEAADAISDLLPTLEVTGDTCYVFIQPKTTSPYFGPLLTGEKIKWLNADAGWTRVWIPRLRITGWVKNALVRETIEADPKAAKVPDSVLSRVSVATKRAKIREDARIQSPVILVAVKDDEFILLREEKGWFQVWLPAQKKKGWVFGGTAAKRLAE